MKITHLQFALLSIGGLILGAACAQGKPASSPPLHPATPQRALVARYCAGCHNARSASGEFVVTALDPDHPERNARQWEKAIVKIRAGMMPPAGAPRPNRAAALAFVSALETRIDSAAAADPNPGRPALHRLNRTEYANSVRDLLDLNIDVTPLLPPDDMSHGFDNMAEVLNVSPALLAGYVRAAGKISRAAVGEPNAAPAEEIYHLPSTLSQTRHIAGTPFGTRGGIVIRHNFPADGEYVFKMTLYFTTNTFLFGMYQKGEQLEVAVNGARVALFPINPMMKVDEDLHTPPIKVKAGPQTITVAFIQKAAGPVEDFVQPFDHSLGDLFLGRTQGLTGLPHLRDVAIKGPYHVTGVSDTPSRRRIFICSPKTPADELPCARKILSALARQAYRRPVTEADVKDLLTIYRLGRNHANAKSGDSTTVEAKSGEATPFTQADSSEHGPPRRAVNDPSKEPPANRSATGIMTPVADRLACRGEVASPSPQTDRSRPGTFEERNTAWRAVHHRQSTVRVPLRKHAGRGDAGRELPRERSGTGFPPLLFSLEQRPGCAPDRSRRRRQTPRSGSVEA